MLSWLGGSKVLCHDLVKCFLGFFVSCILFCLGFTYLWVFCWFCFVLNYFILFCQQNKCLCVWPCGPDSLAVVTVDLSGQCLTGLWLRRALFSVCHSFRRAFISGGWFEGRKGKGEKETCLTSDGSLAAWVPVLCSWAPCSVLICELCLNVFLQLDVQRDVPLMFHGIYFYAAAFLRALIIALLLLALDFHETCRNFVPLGFLFFCQTGRKLANE